MADDGAHKASRPNQGVALFYRLPITAEARCVELGAPVTRCDRRRVVSPGHRTVFYPCTYTHANYQPNLPGGGGGGTAACCDDICDITSTPMSTRAASL